MEQVDEIAQALYREYAEAMETLLHLAESRGARREDLVAVHGPPADIVADVATGARRWFAVTIKDADGDFGEVVMEHDEGQKTLRVVWRVFDREKKDG